MRDYAVPIFEYLNTLYDLTIQINIIHRNVGLSPENLDSGIKYLVENDILEYTEVIVSASTRVAIKKLPGFHKASYEGLDSYLSKRHTKKRREESIEWFDYTISKYQSKAVEYWYVPIIISILSLIIAFCALFL